MPSPMLARPTEPLREPARARPGRWHVHAVAVARRSPPCRFGLYGRLIGLRPLPGRHAAAPSNLATPLTLIGWCKRQAGSVEHSKALDSACWPSGIAAAAGRAKPYGCQWIRAGLAGVRLVTPGDLQFRWAAHRQVDKQTRPTEIHGRRRFGRSTPGCGPAWRRRAVIFRERQSGRTPGPCPGPTRRAERRVAGTELGRGSPGVGGPLRSGAAALTGRQSSAPSTRFLRIANVVGARCGTPRIF